MEFRGEVQAQDINLRVTDIQMPFKAMSLGEVTKGASVDRKREGYRDGYLGDSQMLEPGSWERSRRLGGKVGEMRKEQDVQKQTRRPSVSKRRRHQPCQMWLMGQVG